MKVFPETHGPPYLGPGVLRCHLCDTLGPPIFCEICDIYLCQACVWEHLSDESTEHKEVPYRKWGLNSKCSKHSTHLYDLYCEQCDTPFCLECVSSGIHLGHKQDRILKNTKYQERISTKRFTRLGKLFIKIRCTLYKIKQSIEDLKKVRQRDKTLQPPR